MGLVWLENRLFVHDWWIQSTSNFGRLYMYGVVLFTLTVFQRLCIRDNVFFDLMKGFEWNLVRSNLISSGARFTHKVAIAQVKGNICTSSLHGVNLCKRK